MKVAILSLLATSAAAFAPSTSNSRVSTAANAAIDELKSIAEKSNPVLKVGLLRGKQLEQSFQCAFLNFLFSLFL